MTMGRSNDHRSGSIRAVIRVCDSADADLVVVLASREAPDERTLSDWEWFHEDAAQVGVADLVGVLDWDDLKPGLWVVEGYMWGDPIVSVDGDDYDGGFDVERAEPLDIQRLFGGWLGHPEDQSMARAIYADLGGPEETGRQRAKQRLDAMLEVLVLVNHMAEEGDVKP